MSDIITEREQIYRAALDTWGDVAPVYMLFEEMSELQKEVCKNGRGKDNQREIAEEIADAEIMLEQMKILFDCADLSGAFKTVKVGRLKQRLEKAGVEFPYAAQLPGEVTHHTEKTHSGLTSE